jgi:hypothetical protein
MCWCGILFDPGQPFAFPVHRCSYKPHQLGRLWAASRRRRANDHYHSANVCDEGRRHAQRGAVPSAPCWNPNILSSLLQNQPKADPSSRHRFPICRPRPAQQTQSPTRGAVGLPRDHARQWRRATDPYLLYSNVCGVGRRPAAGMRTHNCLVSRSEFLSGSLDHPKQTLFPRSLISWVSLPFDPLLTDVASHCFYQANVCGVVW